jgi:hypothetical protein
MIFKVEGSKCIFCKTYGTPPMFDIFFISVPLLSILPFHKKLKSISLRLKLNHQKKKKFEDQMKKIKKFHNPFTIIREKINSGVLHSKKLTSFKVIFN